MKCEGNFFCLCMSPAIDAAVRVRENLRSGVVFKDVDETENVGGKGLNVARWLSRRGSSVTLGGLLGRDNASGFEREMESCGICDAFLRVPGVTRRNEMIVTPDASYKLNRKAFPRLTGEDWSERQLLECWRNAGTPMSGGVAILSGSLPPAVPVDFYATFGAALREEGMDVVLDASGVALREGIACRPHLIKPNADECVDLVGFVPRAEEEFVRVAERLTETVALALVSDGANGCWFAERCDGLRLWRVPSPSVEATDTTAAGDTLLAEFCYWYFPKRELTEEGMRYAVAAGAAAVTRPGSEPPDPQLVEELAQSVNPLRIR